MSRRRKPRCGGKVRYPDHAAAVRALHKIAGPNARHQGHNGDRPRSSYPCPHCKGYHLSKRGRLDTW